MEAASARWRQITPSQFQWEAEALEYVRAQLPDADPIQAWSNFEFVSGGSINEVDLLVATRKGVFLIEIKSHPGKISGSQSLWTWHRPDGSRSTMDNPLFLANTKAKRLKSLLQRALATKGGRKGGQVPFIETLVFLSDPLVDVALSPELADRVVKRDLDPALVTGGPGGAPGVAAGQGAFRGVIETVHAIGEQEASSPRFRQFAAQDAETLVSGMSLVGIKESTKSRRVGGYQLTLPAMAERGTTQDFVAQHEQLGTVRRVRIYSNVANMSPEQARLLKDAATREYLASERVHLDGVVRALHFEETDLGPAVIYDYDRDAVRLDHFLAEYGNDLTLEGRLEIARRLADTLRQVHSRRVTHRMLTPQSVWMRPTRAADLDRLSESKAIEVGARTWLPEIADFSMAAAEPGGTAGTTTTRFGRLPTAATGDVEAVLADATVEAYLAPEAFTDPHAEGQALDVFSVGAITYLLVTGQPPAESRAELREALATGGLRVSARVPEIDPNIDDVVREATSPVVTDRFARMADLATGLELVIQDLARPLESDRDDAADDIDPLQATHGAVLADRFLVTRRLGKGSTALALLAYDDHTKRDVVLKLSLGGGADDRIRAEAEALEGLRHPALVELYEPIELGGRPALVLAFAGDRSLDVELRQDGPASPEFLQRWGTDLLEAVRYLEREGRVHRDIKPDNLGIVPQGKNDERHLVLFDFSLATAPVTDLDAGTPGYLEPFLAQRPSPSWDLWAERYATAVTLHELATGELPTWGDGRTDPSFTEGEATIAVEALDPELRAPLGSFFARALRRDYTERFDTAEDMLRAWQRAFEGFEAEDEPPVIPVEADRPARRAEPDADGSQNRVEVLATGSGGAARDAVAPADVLPPGLRLDDPVVSLGVKGKLRSSLRRLGVQQVRDLAALDPATVNRTRGVSPTSRKHILRLRSQVLVRFADELTAAPTRRARTGSGASVPSDRTVAPTPSDPATGGHLPLPTSPDDAPIEVARLDLDALALRLVPTRGTRGKEGAVADIVRVLLGLDSIDDDTVAPTAVRDDWPLGADVARELGVSPATVSKALQKGRSLWQSSPELLAVGHDLVAALGDLGGVASVSELADAVLDSRGSGADDATRLAGAVVRALLECVGPVNLPLGLRRQGPRVLVALEGTIEVDGEPITFDAAETLARAAIVGERADELVAEQAYVVSTDAVAGMRTVEGVERLRLSDGRLVRLGAAASARATANAAADLVRRDATAVDALRWSRAALVGADSLAVAELADRVRVRFPTTVLPSRPALDAVVADAGLPLRWDAAADRYTTVGAQPGALTTFTNQPSRHETVLQPTELGEQATPSLVGPDVAPVFVDPAVAAARTIEDHLTRSRRDGGFLALRVSTDRLPAARAALARFHGDGMTTIDLERRFLAHLDERLRITGAALPRAIAADAGGPGSSDWTRLGALTAPAIDAVVDDVIAAGPAVLAWFPGVLVRHQGPAGLGPIERLRDAVATRTGGLTTLWLVVVGPTIDAKPTVDGTAVPVIGPAEWATLTDGWLKNLHRSEGRVA